MPTNHLETASHPNEPLSKRSRTDTPGLDHALHSLVSGASQMSISTPSQTISDPNYVHRLKLEGRAAINNAADTRYFLKNKALVYQFVDLSDPVENELGELLSCTLRCGICGNGRWSWQKKGKSKGSTSNIAGHMHDKHNTVWAAAKRADKTVWAAMRGIDETPGDTEPLPPTAIPPFNMDEFHRKITRWIITSNHAFTEVENEEWRELMVFVRPALQDHLIRSSAIREKLLAHADTTREHTKQYLKYLPGLMAIACDAWTSSNRIAFLAITGSWITEDWKLQESLLDFAQLRGTHTGEHMASIVATTIADLGIADKVVSLVSDNASNNGTLVRHLSSLLKHSSPGSRWDGSKGHIRCLAHIIHLAVMSLVRGLGAVPESVDVKDFDYDDNTFNEDIAEALVAESDLELSENDEDDIVDPLVNLQSGISKIRKIAKIVRSSPQRMELFRSVAELIEDRNERVAREQNRLYKRKNIKTLVLDVVTRWNSLLFVLERAEEFKEAIDALTTHPKVKIYRPYALSPDDWDVVSRFFRGASLRISGEKYPTLSFSLRIYFLLINYATKLEKDPIVLASAATRNGLRAFLDPRYKDTLFQANSSLLEELFSKEWISDCAKALAETCDELYDSNSTTRFAEVLPQNMELGDTDDFEHAFKASVPQRSGLAFNTRPVTKEIAEYLAEDVIPEGNSPLVWWKNNAARFPRLALMARDFLCIPGSSVAVERVLSIGRDVISLRRPSLSANTIQSLMAYRADVMLEKRANKSAL